jgi:putative addiction module component (TIGR02574 family)
MMSTALLSELLRLSVAERIQLVQDLWDSVAAEATADPGRLPVSKGARHEVLCRSEAYRRNPGAAIPLEEALERIERSLG